MADQVEKRDKEEVSDEEILRHLLSDPEVMARIKETQAKIARRESSDRGMTEEELRAFLRDDPE